jgi:NADH-quinone oxidoreductase subunit N
MTLFLPELILLLGSLVLFAVSLGTPKRDTLRSLVVILATLVFLTSLLALKQNGTLFFGAYRVDIFSQLFKVLIASATLVVILFSSSGGGIREDVTAEYYMFLFIGVLGLMMLVSSVELLAIFVALELSSFAVYIMVPMRSPAANGIQMEAGMKYLLFGVMATAFTLFGMSYIFGLTGSTYLSDIIAGLDKLYNQPAALVAMLMILVSFFYKLAIFPFHFWVPDVYEGAANETTAFIAAVPKIAAAALMIRLVAMISADGEMVANLLLVLAVGSMFYGNFSALAQKDVKRLLGFSGISHAGFVLFALITFQENGYALALYYIVGYAVMTLACFLVICNLTPDGRNLEIQSFNGLYQRSPLLALTLTIGLFALAGIPPFVGFTGKFMVLYNGLKDGYLIAVILAAINTAIAIYYYLSIVRAAYCTDPETSSEAMPAQSAAISFTSVALLIIIIAMGVAPAPFLAISASAIGAIL